MWRNYFALLYICDIVIFYIFYTCDIVISLSSTCVVVFNSTTFASEAVSGYDINRDHFVNIKTSCPLRDLKKRSANLTVLYIYFFLASSFNNWVVMCCCAGGFLTTTTREGPSPSSATPGRLPMAAQRFAVLFIRMIASWVSFFPSFPLIIYACNFFIFLGGSTW